MLRQLVILENSVLELIKLIHPTAIIPVELNNKAVSNAIVFNILSFFLLYLIIFIFGSVFMASLGLDFETTIGASIEFVGNIGTGLGAVGPAYNYAGIPNIGK